MHIDVTFKIMGDVRYYFVIGNGISYYNNVHIDFSTFKQIC